MSERTNWENFFAGFLVGGLLGAGIALLFAPASGKETRKYLKTHAQKAFEAGKDELAKLRSIIHEELVRLGESKEAFKEAWDAAVKAHKEHGKSGEATS